MRVIDASDARSQAGLTAQKARSSQGRNIIGGCRSAGEVAPVNRPAWLRAWALPPRAWPAWRACAPPASPQAWRRRRALPRHAAASVWPRALRRRAWRPLPLWAWPRRYPHRVLAATRARLAAARGLLVRIRRHRCDQRGAGLLRPGIDDHRLADRIVRVQHVGGFRHRRLQARGEEARGRLAAGRRCTAAGGHRHRTVVVVACRPLALAVAHFVAQVRRIGIDRARFSTEPIEGRSHDRPPLRKTALQQLRGTHRARRTRGGAEHDRDQPPAVARGRGHEVVAGGADETGLEAVGAFDSGRSAG